jgi:transposase InsO family protein
LCTLGWFRARGIPAERVMTATGSAYRSCRFAKALRWLAVRHIFTRPSTPKTNGKADRLIQTLLRDWVCGLAN